MPMMELISFMKKIKLTSMFIILKVRIELFFLMIFYLNSCTNNVSKNSTTSVDYSKDNTIKIIKSQLYETSYFKTYELKISINLPLGKNPSKKDSINISNFVRRQIININLDTTSYINLFVFYETDFTNKVIETQKGLVFCEYSPCLFTLNKKFNEWDSGKL
jgi:hypothetical protein